MRNLTLCVLYLLQLEVEFLSWDLVWSQAVAEFPLQTLSYQQIFAENCMKIKVIGPRGRRASLAPFPLPLDPPTLSLPFVIFLVYWSNFVSVICIYLNTAILCFSVFDAIQHPLRDVWINGFSDVEPSDD